MKNALEEVFARVVVLQRVARVRGPTGNGHGARLPGMAAEGSVVGLASQCEDGEGEDESSESEHREDEGREERVVGWKEKRGKGRAPLARKERGQSD